MIDFEPPYYFRSKFRVWLLRHYRGRLVTTNSNHRYYLRTLRGFPKCAEMRISETLITSHISTSQRGFWPIPSCQVFSSSRRGFWATWNLGGLRKRVCVGKRRVFIKILHLKVYAPWLRHTTTSVFHSVSWSICKEPYELWFSFCWPKIMLLPKATFARFWKNWHSVIPNPIFGPCSNLQRRNYGETNEGRRTESTQIASDI